MNIQPATFSKGDWIVHARYGVGQVSSKALNLSKTRRTAHYPERFFLFNGTKQ